VRWSLGSQQILQSFQGDTAAPTLRFTLPPVTHPQPVRLERTLLRDARSDAAVGWTLWVLPDAPALDPGLLVAGDDDRLAGLFDGARRIGADDPIDPATPVVVAVALTSPILDYLQAGGRVLHLTSSRPGSFKQEGTWFLRGTTWAPPEPKAFFDRCPRDLLGDLQLFELGGETVIRGKLLWEQVDPLLAFIETHDLLTVRPNLLLFDTAVGQGRLIVSALRHEGGPQTHYAGWWLARLLVDYLQHGPRSQCRLAEDTVRALRESLAAETIEVGATWCFLLDPDDVGVARGYHQPDFDDSDWQVLETRSAEEGGIWNRYDGWGWYRRTVSIQESWKGRPIRIVFDSVDDMYRLYVNGRPAGGHGQLDRSETSFLRRTWLDITEHVQPGHENTLVVRVHDWVGAGGLNGKVWLTTGPVGPEGDLLQR